MKHDHDDSPRINSEDPAPYTTNPFSKPTPEQPPFGDLADEDAYEEPERDTDYTHGYREHSIDDETIDGLDEELHEGLPEGDQGAPDNDEPEDEDYDTDGSVSGEAEMEDDWDEPHMTADSVDSADDGWLSDDDGLPDSDDIDSRQPLPLSLIAVAVLAVLLLTAGGYGVMQQRSATQEEIRQLQAALATAASPQDVNEGRAALQESKELNAQMSAQISALTLDNRRLGDTVAGLEAQLEAQQLTLAKPAAKPAPAPSPVKTATPKPASAPIATKPAAGTWFVNFGSYGQRDVAQQWVGKIKPGNGRVITAPGAREGKTFYRVRVVDLANRESAEKVAAVLEREYGLPKLWIGQQ